MKDLFRLAAELDETLAHRGWRYCFIGGIALQRWGQPRLTNDIDITKLDWTYILEQLQPLSQLKEAPEIIDHLIRLRDQRKGMM